jgi:hypothetical protein
MRTKWQYLPGMLVLLCALMMLMHGAIPQYAHYHQFADTSAYWQIPNAMDVLSNLVFAIIGLLGLLAVWAYFSQKANPWRPKDVAYTVFVISILATSFGSFFYHLAPDDSRLFWDRLPIALACASLIAAVRTDALNTRTLSIAVRDLTVLLVFATVSVLWWQRTGDLRPYLALQVLAILLIPIWQTIYSTPRQTRWVYAFAIGLYVLAKIAETYDAAILLQTGFISGHTIKHLLASGAAAVIIWHWLYSSRHQLA